MSDGNDISPCKIGFMEAASTTYHYIAYSMRGPWDHKLDHLNPYNQDAEKMRSCGGPNMDLKKSWAVAGSISGIIPGVIAGITLKGVDVATNVVTNIADAVTNKFPGAKP
jgi:hypothetical protein